MSKRASGKSNIDIVKDYLSGDRPFVQFGYQGVKDTTKREEGEMWTDASGRKWVMRNGTRVSQNFDAIHAIAKQKCTCCGVDLKVFGTRIDKKVYGKTGLCFDCLIKQDTDRKIKGTFREHEERKFLKNQLAFFIVSKQKIRESYDYMKKEKDIKMVHSNGDVETWAINEADRLNVLTQCVKDQWIACRQIKLLQKRIEEIESSLNAV